MARLSALASRFGFLALMVAAAAAFSIGHNEADYDLWHRLAVGGAVEATGGVLGRDIFSYLPTLPRWIDHEWGSGVVFWQVADAAGEGGLLALKIGLYAAALLAVAAAAQIRAREFLAPGWSWMVLVAVAVAPGFTTTVRCQAFTFAGFACLLAILERYRRTKRPWVLAGLPVLMLAWVNLHGGYLAGLGLIGLYLAGAVVERYPAAPLAAALAGCLAATLANPYGLGIWDNVADAVSRARPYMGEWTGLTWWPDPWKFLGAKVLIVLAGAAFAADVARACRTHGGWRRFPWTTWLVIGVTLFLGWRHVRHLALFALAAGALGWPRVRAWAALGWQRAGNLAGLSAVARPLAVLLRALLPAGVAILLAGACQAFGLGLRMPPHDYGLGPVGFVEANGLKGNLVVPFNWSSYASYRLFPGNLVNIDGRFEQVYPEEVFGWSTAFQFGGPGQDALLREGPPDVIVTATGDASVRLLRDDPAWRLAYEDRSGAVWVPAEKAAPAWQRPAPARGLDIEGFRRRLREYLAER